MTVALATVSQDRWANASSAGRASCSTARSARIARRNSDSQSCADVPLSFTVARMGRNSKPAPLPAWVQTVGAMLDSKGLVRAACNTCHQYRDVDLARLVKLKGRDYSLIDRRIGCRLTPGCLGMVRFHYQGGVMRPLWTSEAVERWMWESELAVGDRAIEVLRAALDRAATEIVQTPRVAAALTALKRRCAERTALDWFWTSAGTPNGQSRWQNCNAALNAIRRQCRSR
ncbi:hypothetical protein ABC347_14210 [Sphingomonas sp. 1P06PA]|uniref:hypothetical protein n=1 Tax=Sphingomonas sp. 1P06PA TaxID=554121 RepID=UPI0039A4B22E